MSAERLRLYVKKSGTVAHRPFHENHPAQRADSLLYHSFVLQCAPRLICRQGSYSRKRLKHSKASFSFTSSFLASDLKREKEAGMGVGYITLITFAVLGFVLGVVSLLIFLYQRKMGRYNFRIKSDNFSYQVFYD